ncbi:uncharacterized protein LOC120253508 [Dioscorea cayenensis subsp. rotundata]|uniref:Uncharacterized protein LOC120253508 n=1 Tax=Dioscorea cayennensis subsp. rotundata TaxID=55577 RepID=A0AB40ASR0_DIOCR|nr:uncharacterized protein LOC120253508 [Dioscorea cayenensis subsp. rotundata]
MAGKNRSSVRWGRSSIPTSQAESTGASITSSATVVQSDTGPPTPASTTTPAPIFIPSTVALTTTSMPPPTSTTPATIPPTTTTSPSTMFDSTEGISTIDSGSSRRLRIYVLSDRFVSHGHAISKFIHEKNEGERDKEGYTWSKIDKHTHDFYWREFKKHYYWPIEEENAIKAIWEKVCRGHYSRNLCRWHKSYKETGRSLVRHFRGHLLRFDIFCKTHVNKEGKGVDSRAQTDAMQKMVETASQTLLDGSQPSPLDMDAMYLEASGGEKKKRVYGLGSHASSMYQESLCSGATSAPPPPSASTVPPEIVSEMEGMKKK